MWNKHKGFASWRLQKIIYIYIYIHNIYIYIYIRINIIYIIYTYITMVRVKRRWDAAIIPCLVGFCLSTLLPCLKERQANQHSLGAVGNFESVGHGNIIHLGPHFTIIGLGVPLSQPPSQVSNMKIHYPNLPLKMQLVHYIHGWWGKIIAMNLKIYETAQDSFKKPQLEWVYRALYNRYIMLQHLDTYWGILTTKSKSSKQGSKSLYVWSCTANGYGKSSASIFTLWNFPRAEKGGQEYWICRQQTNYQTAKGCNHVRWLDKQENMRKNVTTNEWLYTSFYFGSWCHHEGVLRISISIIVERPKQITWKSLTQAAILLSLKQCYCPLVNKHGNKNCPWTQRGAFTSRCKNPMWFEGKLLFWLMVEPPHLKNMLVKLDIFPK